MEGSFVLTHHAMADEVQPTHRELEEIEKRVVTAQSYLS